MRHPIGQDWRVALQFGGRRGDNGYGLVTHHSADAEYYST
jgi:hypothetical protein